MRRIAVIAGALAFLLPVGAGAASASPAPAGTAPQGCKHVSYTGAGGYYSMGQFYSEPGDEATVTTKWCFANGLITSYAVTYTTVIPTSLEPQITTNESLIRRGHVLDVQLNGDYNSGVGNNVGIISLVGEVTATGWHRFFNATTAGG